jgi:hypothetical protein
VLGVSAAEGVEPSAREGEGVRVGEAVDEALLEREGELEGMSDTVLPPVRVTDGVGEGRGGEGEGLALLLPPPPTTTRVGLPVMVPQGEGLGVVVKLPPPTPAALVVPHEDRLGDDDTLLLGWPVVLPLTLPLGALGVDRVLAVDLALKDALALLL